LSILSEHTPFTPPNVVSLSGNFDYLNDSGNSRDKRPLSAVVIAHHFEDTVHDLDEEIIYQSEVGESEGTFLIDVTDKGKGWKYELCVQNGVAKPRGKWPNEFNDMPTGSDGKDRKVGVSFRVVEQESDDDSVASGEVGVGGGPKGPPEGYLEALAEARKLVSQMKTMLDSQAYSREREAMHRDISEQTNERVWKWTVAEAVVLVTVGTGQIWYLKTYFDRTKRL
jgi:hypothetical protein